MLSAYPVHAAYISLGVLSAIEILVWLPGFWRLRKLLAAILIPLLALASGLIFGWTLTLATGLLLIFSLYRIINLLKVLENRLQERYLRRVAARASCWLIGSQALVLALSWLIGRYSPASIKWLYAVSVIQLLIAAILWLSTRRHLRTAQPPAGVRSLPDKEPPTLSVMIPARNETDDLEACLQSLISSNYPKLEILVLDDCSQNKRTPGIIRDFAQSGVRFIAGEVPPDNWLAKNYAYRQLALEANGELLLFCGVDTRFRPDSLRSMVEMMTQKNKNMISFIPRNQLPPRYSVEELLVQPARYAWELSLPRRLFKRPPVLSTCWLIATKELRAAGGFKAVSRSISPESYFARQLAARHDGYSFLQSNQAVDLGSSKSLAEQRATAIRTRYPQLHRRPELVIWSGIGELAVLVWPFALVISAALYQRWVLLALSGLTTVLLISFYARVVSLAYRRFLWRGLWTLPMVAIYDIGLLNYSMWRYEFREVIWKGRNVCVPVMRAFEVNAGSGKRP